MGALLTGKDTGKDDEDGNERDEYALFGTVHFTLCVLMHVLIVVAALHMVLDVVGGLELGATLPKALDQLTDLTCVEAVKAGQVAWECV